MKRLLAITISALLMASLVIGQTTIINATYSWTAPTTGSAVHHYAVQSSNNGTTWTTLTVQPTSTSVTLACPVGVPIYIRVAGVDAQNRQGVWSESSDQFIPDAGAPGACGKPVRN